MRRSQKSLQFGPSGFRLAAGLLWGLCALSPAQARDSQAAVVAVDATDAPFAISDFDLTLDGRQVEVVGIEALAPAPDGRPWQVLVYFDTPLLTPGGLEAATDKPAGLGAAMAACLAFTFFNPHVYLDTVVLIGALSASYAGAARLAFGAGAVLASFVWFFGLGYGARWLAPVFAARRAWQVLDIAIGLVMWSLAAGLAARVL